MGRMPFLSPKLQCQSAEGNDVNVMLFNSVQLCGLTGSIFSRQYTFLTQVDYNIYVYVLNIHTYKPKQ